ncbi:unnamed protein product [Trichobilharzia regenti]|nr:unnamed protein product [Trichobilharzia regenti]
MDDIGSVIQLLEFFNVFGPFIGFVVPHTNYKSLESSSSSSSHHHSTTVERVTSTSTSTTLSSSSCASSACSTSSILTLSILENSLLESDPCGLLADLFISILSAIRRFELEASSRQPTPNMSSATVAAASAVAAAEAGFAVNTQISHVSGAGIDYNSLHDEDTASPEDSALFRVLREAGASTRLCELVGIPTQAATIAAGRAAVAASVVFNTTTTTGNTMKEETQVNLSTVSRNSVTRAATTAVIAGAASLPPLDRAGLTEALWLHITSAAAKGGGWRGQIWGGTRPLDDPSVMLARNNADLVEKLKKVTVYELTPHEKLVLLTCLMDELLLQPQVRERMEDQYERVRLLRNQLRTLQMDRAQLMTSNPVIDEDNINNNNNQEVLSQIKKLNSANNDGRSHLTTAASTTTTTPTPTTTAASVNVLRGGRVNRGRGRPLSRKNPSLYGRKAHPSPLRRQSQSYPGTQTYQQLQSVHPQNNDYAMINGRLSNNNNNNNRQEVDSAAAATAGVAATSASSSGTSSSCTPNNINEKLIESLLEEQKLLDAITQVSRGCSMIPLGQDRFYR